MDLRDAWPRAGCPLRLHASACCANGDHPLNSYPVPPLPCLRPSPHLPSHPIPPHACPARPLPSIPVPTVPSPPGLSSLLALSSSKHRTLPRSLRPSCTLLSIDAHIARSIARWLARWLSSLSLSFQDASPACRLSRSTGRLALETSVSRSNSPDARLPPAASRCGTMRSWKAPTRLRP